MGLGAIRSGGGGCGRSAVGVLGLRPFHAGAQIGVEDVGVFAGGGDLGVAEHLLRPCLPCATKVHT